MGYLIDGHNLIGQLPDLSLADPNDEARLVQKLRGFAARTRKRCVVIFDQGLPGGRSSMSSHSVQVVFAAAHHSTADRILSERIRHERDATRWTVISSDRDVLETARRHGMQSMRASQFARMLETPPTQRPGPDEAADPRLTDEEVEEWLRLFGGEGGGL